MSMEFRMNRSEILIIDLILHINIQVVKQNQYYKYKLIIPKQLN